MEVKFQSFVPFQFPTRTTRTPAFLFPRHPMITHVSDSHQIPSQSKTNSKLEIKKKNAQNLNLKNFQEILHATHLLKLLDEMYEYEMDPTRTALQSGHGMRDGRTDGRTDRRTDGVKPIYPPNNFVGRGI